MAPERSTRPPSAFETLQAVTRELATGEDLQVVLDSIVGALVQRADAVLARVFLPMEDEDCGHCRQRPAATPRVGPTLHMAAHAGASDVDDREPPDRFHRIPFDSMLPAAVQWRAGVPLLVEDWREDTRFARDPEIQFWWERLGVVSAGGYPMTYQGERLGIIGYISRRRISREEFETLGIFADQAALAIKTAYLFRERERHRLRLAEENAYLQDEVRVEHGFTGIVGASPALDAVLRKVRQVAGTDTTVLLTGETGTGKELVARAVHEAGARRERALVKVNCGAIPAGVVESELFGHEKGAFTGAIQRRIGRFELADRGTLFLDEVGELSLDVQVKLLRVLQEQEFERVGGDRPIRVDVRLIAATNRDLAQEVAAGRYRADLFYRLNVFPVRIPPLRERRADIPLLAEHFLAQFQRKLGKPLRRLTPSAMAELERYPWPGNVRELQNVLERACVLARGPDVELAAPLRLPPARGGTPASGVRAAPLIPTLADHERAQIRRALALTDGQVHGPRGAAALLGVNASTLRSRMQKLGITRRA